MSVTNLNASNFQSEVMESDKPVLVDFWATWCGPCRMFSPIVDEVASERSDIKVCKVNVDDEPELASQFGIVSIPTIVLIKDGKVVRRSSGAMPKNSLVQWIEA